MPLSLESIADRPELSQEADSTPDSIEDDAIAISTLPAPVPTVSPQAAPPPIPVAPQPTPQLTAAPPPSVLETFEPELEPTPEPTPEPTSTPSPTPVALEAGVVVPFRDDFPHPAGSTAGCFKLENCRRLDNIGSYRQTAQYLVAQLEAQGYHVTPREDTDDTGVELYEIIQTDDLEGEVQYLSIFSDGIGSAVYTITQEILSLEELRELG
ncbi:MAG: hypothetical protein AAFV72_23050 [Cyanobacteria bacterium J06635_1]